MALPYEVVSIPNTLAGLQRKKLENKRPKRRSSGRSTLLLVIGAEIVSSIRLAKNIIFAIFSVAESVRT